MTKECEGNMGMFKEECLRKAALKGDIDEDITQINDIQEKIGKILDSNKINKFEDKKLEFEEYSKKWTSVIEAAIKNKKADIDKKIKEYDDQITNIEKEIPLLEKAIIEAIKQYSTSNMQFQLEQNTYSIKFNEIIDYYGKNGKIESNLNNLNLWEKEIENDYKNDKPSMYVLMSEFNRVLNDTSIKKFSDLESDFYDSWKKFNNTKKDKTEKEHQIYIATRKYNDKREQLKTLKKERKNKILNRIKENGQQEEESQTNTGNTTDDTTNESEK